VLTRACGRIGLRFRSSPIEMPYVVGFRDNKGDEAMPNKVKFVSEDMSTFFDKCVPAYAAPGEVTEGDRPLDRVYWDREVRD